MILNITEGEMYYTNELDAIQDTIKKNFPNFDVHIARGKYPFVSVRVTKKANKNIQHRLSDMFTIRQEADGRITCTCSTYDNAEFFDLIGIVNYFNDYLNNPNTENNRGYFESVKRHESFRRKRTHNARIKENYYTTDTDYLHDIAEEVAHILKDMDWKDTIYASYGSYDESWNAFVADVEEQLYSDPQTVIDALEDDDEEYIDHGLIRRITKYFM